MEDDEDEVEELDEDKDEDEDEVEEEGGKEREGMIRTGILRRAIGKGGKEACHWHAMGMCVH